MSASVVGDLLVESACVRKHDEYDDLSSTFAAACKAADEKQARQPRDSRLDLLRTLMDNNVSLDTMWAELNRARLRGRAARSTLEALMYSLRQRGVAALGGRNTIHRLAQLSDQQLREVAVRLQRFKPHIAPAWPADDVAVLIAVRSKAIAKNP